jgi:hypothetical protein
VRYGTVQSSNGGTMSDVCPYLEWLGEHAHELPPGAQAFALDPEHYDFSRQWSPRSASFDQMSTRFTEDGVEVTLVLAAWGAAPHQSSSCGTAACPTSSPMATMVVAHVRDYSSTSCSPILTA